MIQITLGKLRYDRHMTLSQLSVKSGVSIAHLNNIENGKKMPTIEVLCRIAHALGVPITDLYKEIN